MNNNVSNTMRLVVLGLMTAILLILAYTPLGYLNIGPLSITFNMVPVAISAVVLGPVGGLITGFIFGMTSFLQCIGVGQLSAFGAMLFSINPISTFVVCVVARSLDGFLLGFIYRALSGKTSITVSTAITGFCSAALNTVFFMTSLMVLFGNSDYLTEMRGGMNVLAFVVAFVGINAVFEVVVATVLTAVICVALFRAHVIPAPVKKAPEAV